jgi:hypothetical protein
VAGGLALPQPAVAVGVEDAAAEQVLDHGHPELALGVVAEVGLENVLDVGRVGGDDAAAEADGLEGHGVRGAALQDAGRPLEEAVPVLDLIRCGSVPRRGYTLRPLARGCFLGSRRRR